jgi:hypothetical protein
MSFATKVPVWDQGITRRDNLLKQPQPAQTDLQTSDRLKQGCDVRGNPLLLACLLQEEGVVGFRSHDFLNPIDAGPLGLFVFGMSVHTGLTLEPAAGSLNGVALSSHPKVTGH